MRVSEVMKREVVTVSPDETVEAAARRMRDADVGFLPVCDADGRPLGTLTDRDVVLRVVAERRSSALPVRAVMTHEVVACRPGDAVSDAERLMHEHHKARLLCTDARGRLKGVLALADIAAHREHAMRTRPPIAEQEPPSVH
ncbi:MAG: CBS domain-containing protein [Myxococcaceae bacterium]|nr:CBS domain-containing protein [Myxococcaceae bacterium]